MYNIGLHLLPAVKGIIRLQGLFHILIDCPAKHLQQFLHHFEFVVSLLSTTLATPLLTNLPCK